jgi:hypothetical protein
MVPSGSHVIETVFAGYICILTLPMVSRDEVSKDPQLLPVVSFWITECCSAVRLTESF